MSMVFCTKIKLLTRTQWFHYFSSQQFNVESTLSQRCEHWNNVDWLHLETETKSYVGFSTLHNTDTSSVPDVEAKSKQRYTKLKQPYTTLVNRCINIVST